jgi:hypothetical protein
MAEAWIFIFIIFLHKEKKFTCQKIFSERYDSEEHGVSTQEWHYVNSERDSNFQTNH